MNLKWFCVLAACSALFALGKQMAIRASLFVVLAEAALVLAFAALACYVWRQEDRQNPNDNGNTGEIEP